jgi:hypothetical protein
MREGNRCVMSGDKSIGNERLGIVVEARYLRFAANNESSLLTNIASKVVA